MNKIKPKFNDTTTVGVLLNKYGLGLRSIARASNTAPNTVRRVLDIKNFSTALPLQQEAIRKAVERLLRAYRWEGDTATLWQEYDSTLTDNNHEDKAA